MKYCSYTMKYCFEHLLPRLWGKIQQAEGHHHGLLFDIKAFPKKLHYCQHEINSNGI